MDVANRIRAGVVAGVLVAGLAACSPATVASHLRPHPSPTPSPTPTPQTFDVTGTIAVSDYEAETVYTDGASCLSSDGYDDISQGAQVTISDESGTKLAVADLAEGIISGGTCTFAFEFDGVPEGAKLFSVHVGNEARGAVTYERDQLNQPVELTLG